MLIVELLSASKSTRSEHRQAGLKDRSGQHRPHRQLRQSSTTVCNTLRSLSWPHHRSSRWCHTMRTTACTREHVVYCFDVLSAHLSGQPIPRYEGDDKDEEYPLFVTWNTIRPDGSTRLRGCIGNFSPMPLASGLREYALIAALKDRRFSPITLSELPRLECGVSLLTDFEDVEDPFDWELGTHGIHIHFEDPTHVAPAPTDSPASMSSTDSSTSNEPNGLRSKLSSLTSVAKSKTAVKGRARTLSATYLPDVATEQGWTKEETLDSAMRKAGYNGRITDAIRRSIRVTRYQSSKQTIDYATWHAQQ